MGLLKWLDRKANDYVANAVTEALGPQPDTSEEEPGQEAEFKRTA